MSLMEEFQEGIKYEVVDESLETLKKAQTTANICRCCMLETTDSKFLFACPSFVEILQSWIGDVHEQDDLPKTVCSSCESKVGIALEIRETTRRSDEILRGLLFKKFANDKVEIGANSIFLPEMIVDDVKIKDEPVDEEILPPLAIDTSNENDQELEVMQPKDVSEEPTLQRIRKAKRKDETLLEKTTTAPIEVKIDVNDRGLDDDDEDDITDDPEYDEDEKTKDKPHKSSRRKEKIQSAETINRIMSEVSQSLVCHYCGKSTFTQPNRLKKHIYEYHSDTIFSCEICQKVFKSGNNLQRHKKLVHEKFRFKCDQCVCDFYTTSDLKRHKLDEHSDAEAKHQCDLCGKMFKHLILLQTHRKWHIYHSRKPNYNPENREKFRDRKKDARPRCEACSIEKFTNKDDFKQHHENHQGKYDCQLCSKTFKTDNKLRLHKYINHSGKVYHCDKCEYKTTNPSNVQSHRRIHNENRHFECEICAKKTTTRLRMKIHKRIHTGEKPYCCAICGKSFSDPSTFRKHKKRHDLSKPPSTTTDQQCQQQTQPPQQQQHSIPIPVSDRIPLNLPIQVQQLMPPLSEGIPYFT